MTINDISYLLSKSGNFSIKSLDRRRHWHILRALNIYRISFTLITTIIFHLDTKSRFFGKAQQDLFLFTVYVYLISSIIFLALSLNRRPNYRLQKNLGAFLDVFYLSLLIHASGGTSSNLTAMLIVTSAANTIVLSRPASLGLTLWGLLCVVSISLIDITTLQQNVVLLFDSQTMSGFFYYDPSVEELGSTGILGCTLVIASMTTHALAEHARRNELLAQQRTEELLDVAELNEAIVQHLQYGVLVVDEKGYVKLHNDTARNLLNVHLPVEKERIPLRSLSQTLYQRLEDWHHNVGNPEKPFRPNEHLADIIPYFNKLKFKSGTETLIFLEDSQQIAQQLQQIKLAALGRLTASIAHEIRNPLTSIQSAAQLLGESQTLGSSDRRLSEIILDNAKRANSIISDILDLSRRGRPQTQIISILPWLTIFREDFLRAHASSSIDIKCEANPSNLSVSFDSNHLRQILWNLCNNARHHGTLSGTVVTRIELKVKQEPSNARPYLDVIDFGPGIDPSDARNIFEPFFTTSSKGTGLGLFVSRELCEANLANIQLLSPQKPYGCCFRITFANPNELVKRLQWQ